MIHNMEPCGKPMCTIVYFSYYKYTKMTQVFHERFNNGIIQIIWNRVKVSIFQYFIAWHNKKAVLQKSC